MAHPLHHGASSSHGSLGLSYLSALPAQISSRAHSVQGSSKLGPSSLPIIEWRGYIDYVPSKVISYLKAQQMVGKGCLSYLAFVRDVGVDTPTIDSVPMVRNFSNVFPADLSGMPPDRDIDFGIDLVLSIQPISIPLYHMALTDFKELKEQPQELLDKRFIRPSVSPRGA
ncbi:uncharacterized protein [Nicotiana tomentosiformis]|uniref:uncharacterized protein n=1 Tax=Nicotiana tomentosiformis TaxID=4098 RepID=UPI00388C8AF8